MSDAVYRCAFARHLGAVPVMRLALAMVAIAALSQGAARASDITMLGTFGAWQAYGGLSEDGKGLCGIVETGNDGRSIYLKYFGGTEQLVIQLFKQGWSIPNGIEVPAELQFGNFSPWTVRAHGYRSTVEFVVPLAQLHQFSLEFRAASEYRLTFLTGTEGAWIGQLAAPLPTCWQWGSIERHGIMYEPAGRQRSAPAV